MKLPLVGSSYDLRSRAAGVSRTVPRATALLLCALATTAGAAAAALAWHFAWPIVRGWL